MQFAQLGWHTCIEWGNLFLKKDLAEVFAYFKFQWDPERIKSDTLFVMGARANKWVISVLEDTSL